MYRFAAQGRPRHSDRDSEIAPAAPSLRGRGGSVVSVSPAYGVCSRNRGWVAADNNVCLECILPNMQYYILNSIIKTVYNTICMKCTNTFQCAFHIISSTRKYIFSVHRHFSAHIAC